ncbi:uncharacterized protein LOC110881334 [Helianthus annuus]|uniref:uncharacterized protein LOC110881334 n=1 Tax=Helianthus annuus TaxID=4232 RepID=UPI000B8FD96A|nr:uncharacterized protein LOC110881334 [Helianthus annuus]
MKRKAARECQKLEENRGKWMNIQAKEDKKRKKENDMIRNALRRKPKQHEENTLDPKAFVAQIFEDSTAEDEITYAYYESQQFSPKKEEEEQVSTEKASEKAPVFDHSSDEESDDESEEIRKLEYYKREFSSDRIYPTVEGMEAFEEKKPEVKNTERVKKATNLKWESEPLDGLPDNIDITFTASDTDQQSELIKKVVDHVLDKDKTEESESESKLKSDTSSPTVEKGKRVKGVKEFYEKNKKGKKTSDDDSESPKDRQAWVNLFN